MSILKFENQSGDAGADHWGGLVSSLLTLALREIDTVRLRPVEESDRRRAGLADDERAGKDVARKLGEVVQAQRVVRGAYRRVADSWEVRAVVLNVATGEESHEILVAAGDWLALRDRLVKEILDRLDIELPAEELRHICWARTESEEALSWFSRANDLQDRERPFTQVEETIREAVRADPSFLPARLFLASALGNQGKLDEALTEARQVIELRPGYGAAHLIQGVALLLKGDLAGAERSIRESVRLDPNEPAFHATLAEALMARRRFEEASRKARQAVRLAPTDASIRALLGLILAHARDRQGALQALEAAETLGAADVETLRRLAVSYSILQEPARAVPLYGEFIEKARKRSMNPAALERYERILEALKERLTPTFVTVDAPRAYTESELTAEVQRRLEGDVLPAAAAQTLRANDAMKRWARQIVDGVEGDVERGRAIFQILAPRTVPAAKARAGGARTALEAFSAWSEPDEIFTCHEATRLFVALARSLDLHAFYARVERDYMNRAVDHACAALLVDGKALLVDAENSWFGIEHRQFEVLDDAEAIAQRLFQEHPDQELIDALERLRLAMKLDPGSLRGKIAAAKALIEAEEYEGASSLLENVQELDPDRWDTLHVLGVMALRKNDFEEAERRLKRSLELNPRHGLGYMHLGAALLRLEEYSRAREAFRRAISVGVSQSTATDARKLIIEINEHIGVD